MNTLLSVVAKLSPGCHLAGAWGSAVLVMVAALGVETAPARGEEPSYHREVVRILQKNCQDCHRPGQVAPFSLLTYEQTRKRASDIVNVTETKTMPPWPASTKEGGSFLDARLLDNAEIATLQAWVDAGCLPEVGTPSDGRLPASRVGHPTGCSGPPTCCSLLVRGIPWVPTARTSSASTFSRRA